MGFGNKNKSLREIIHLRITKDTYKKLERKLEKENITASDFIRKLVINKLEEDNQK